MCVIITRIGTNKQCDVKLKKSDHNQKHICSASVQHLYALTFLYFLVGDTLLTRQKEAIM